MDRERATKAESHSSPDDPVYWLGPLREGTDDQRAEARTELGLILERRGLVDDAAEAYWTNVRAQVRDPRPYDRLAAIARQRGDEIGEARIRLKYESIAGSRPDQPRVHDSRHRSRHGRLLLAAAVFLAVVLGMGWGFTPGWMPFPSCTDPRRFPESRDPEGAIQSAATELLREAGINSTRGLLFSEYAAGKYALPPEEALAGYIASKLYWRHTWAKDLSFKDFVAFQGRWRESRAGPLMLRGRINPEPFAGVGLGPMVPQVGWSALLALPSSTCDGAFLQHPNNTRLVRLMQAVVGDTSWLENGR